MNDELNKYLKLGEKMDFSYIPYIPFCIFITWYKTPLELRTPFPCINETLSGYKMKYSEMVYKIHIENYRKCTNTILYDIEYANYWYSTYINTNSKDVSYKYAFPFGYVYYKNGIFQVAHSLKIIYNMVSNTLEVFDPLRQKNNKKYSNIGKVYSKIYETIHRIAQKIPSKPVVIPISDIYGIHNYGLQEIEGRMGPTGHCLLWCEFVGELSLQFLGKSAGEIVDDIMCFAYDNQNGQNGQQQRPEVILRLIIKGYLVDFCNKTGIHFTDEISSYKSVCDYFIKDIK